MKAQFIVIMVKLMQILTRDVLLNLAIIIVAVLVNTRRKHTKIISMYNAALILFGTAMLVVFSLTGVSPMSGFHTDIRIEQISLIPFAGIKKILMGGDMLFALINIAGNILMFGPLGFFIPLLYPKLGRFKATVLYGFLVSLLIECTQLFLCRETDIDDLILNTIGVILGYAVYIAFKKLIPIFAQKLYDEAHSNGSKCLLNICTLSPYCIVVICGFFDRFEYFAQ